MVVIGMKNLSRVVISRIFMTVKKTISGHTPKNTLLYYLWKYTFEYTYILVVLSKSNSPNRFWLLTTFSTKNMMQQSCLNFSKSISKSTCIFFLENCYELFNNVNIKGNNLFELWWHFFCGTKTSYHYFVFWDEILKKPRQKISLNWQFSFSHLIAFVRKY